MIEIPDNPFNKLSDVIKQYQNRIEYISSGGISRTQNYKEIIISFKKDLEKGLDLFDTKTSLIEMVYIVNEMAVNKEFISEILDYEEEFETILLMLKKYERISIYKNIIKLYFNHYSLLNKSEKRINFFISFIKDFLSKYQGKNRLLNHCIKEKEILFNPINLLIDYDYNIDKIKKEFSLLDDYEYISLMLVYKLVQKLEDLEYDEKDNDLFNELINKKELFFKDKYNIKEYVVKFLLNKVITEGHSFPNWKQFILDIIGDPRSSSFNNSNRTSWNKIGEELKVFFIGTLSREDLNLFLEQLSENDIKNYEYRKAFWMAFTDYVKYAKLIIGRDVLSLLPIETQKEIRKDETCYATYNQNEQSAIYIDFGKVKIIEFTHSGKVSGYFSCPIDLSKSSYTKNELIPFKETTKIFRENHYSPKTYTWQKTILKYMNENLDLNIQLEDIKIEEDKKKRSKYSNDNVNNYTLNETRTCKLCGISKSSHEFFNSKRKEYGYGSYCKDCVEEQRKKSNISENLIKCNKCGLKKPTSEFRKNPKTTNGYTYWCVSCMDKGK